MIGLENTMLKGVWSGQATVHSDQLQRRGATGLLMEVRKLASVFSGARTTGRARKGNGIRESGGRREASPAAPGLGHAFDAVSSGAGHGRPAPTVQPGRDARATAGPSPDCAAKPQARLATRSPASLRPGVFALNPVEIRGGRPGLVRCARDGNGACACARVAELRRRRTAKGRTDFR
jgi:hypothetical protein